MNTYRRKKNVLGRAFGIFRSMSEMGRLIDSVYVC